MDFISIIFFVVIVVVFVVIFSLFNDVSSTVPRAPTYEKNRYLLSRAERNFYSTLGLALGDQRVVMCKVRIADVLRTRKGLDSKDRMTAFNKISRKHFDFVLLDPSDLSIVAAIELDDSSHHRNDRQERDRFVENACKGAALTLHRFDVKRAYQVEEMRRVILTTPGEEAEEVS